MPKFHEAVYGKGHLHLITCTCFQKLPKLGEEKHRDVFVRLMDRPEGDGGRGRDRVDRVLDLIEGHPELNEFKYARIAR